MDLKQLKKLQKEREVLKKKSTAFSFDKLIAIGKKDINFFKGIGEKNKERFYSEIGMLLSAGVDLQTSLDISASGHKAKDKLKPVYDTIYQKISKGVTLAGAVESTNQFNSFDTYSILIGENTGELSMVFTKLATYYNKRIAQKRKIVSALSYPFIVLLTTTLAVFFMLKFVVPMFAHTLTQFGGELPALTRLMIALSEKIGTFVLITLMIVLILILLYNRYKSYDAVQSALTSVLLRTPYIGAVIKRTYLLQFTQAMELLLSAHVSLLEGIQLTQKMIRFYPLSTALGNVSRDITNGEFFYNSIKRQSFFDHSMVTLVKVGEEVNELDKIFLQLSKQYETELDYRSGLLITFLEPLMILLLAIVIGVILISMYLPMFKIGSVIR